MVIFDYIEEEFTKNVYVEIIKVSYYHIKFSKKSKCSIYC